ncbi:MAG TPA: aminotransferase class III-fold pyridoxal phosphate-dependent enzyme [Planctomycetota bacterium]|nr:aminotransferase class III-fold pyridoxal phosphate-dependent enzyme [Planctomycetota bacterium]
MASFTFSTIPAQVPTVDTPHRRIKTPIPVPESLPIIRKMLECEPEAMTGMAPVIWDRAEACSIFDPWGNMWLDWTSGVLGANAGHGRREVVDALKAQAEKLLFAYAHPTQPRAMLAARLVEIAPPGLDRVMLFSGGAEALECAIKLSRISARKTGGEHKRIIVSFNNAFHGRTLGSQLAGGISAMKEWIGPPDPAFVQVPFPDGYLCRDTAFDLFERSLKEQNVQPAHVAGVLIESFQGGDANFAPPEYMQRLADWCRRHHAVLTCDEVQAGFGRTGRLFGFEHYGIVPDLACFAKGLSGSLPLSAVLGRAALLDGFPPRSMTTTYGGNPVCAAAALANINLILAEDLPARAAKAGELLHRELGRLARKHPEIGFVHGRGLVAAVLIVKPNTQQPDALRAFGIVEACVRKGLMLFAPVGFAAASIKICPPLIISDDAIMEGIAVLDAALAETA